MLLAAAAVAGNQLPLVNGAERPSVMRGKSVRYLSAVICFSWYLTLSKSEISKQIFVHLNTYSPFPLKTSKWLQLYMCPIYLPSKIILSYIRCMFTITVKLKSDMQM